MDAKPGDVAAATCDDFEDNQPLLSSVDTNPPPTTILDTLKPDLSEYQPGPPAQITPPPIYQFQPSSYYPTEHPPHVQFPEQDIGGSPVEQQPAASMNPRSGESEKILIFSAIIAIACIFCFWPSLICAVPAVVLATSARNDDRRGNIESARIKGRVALGLTVAAGVFSAIAIGIFVGLRYSASINSN